jgi:hypothetical protein
MSFYVFFKYGCICEERRRKYEKIKRKKWKLKSKSKYSNKNENKVGKINNGNEICISEK